MSIEHQEVIKTFQDASLKWVQFRFKKLIKNYACEIKEGARWKEYGQAPTEMAALREAKEVWNRVNCSKAVPMVPIKTVAVTMPTERFTEGPYCGQAKEQE